MTPNDITVIFSTIISVSYDKRIVTYDVEDLDLLYREALPWRFSKVIALLLEDERFLRVTSKCVVNMGWINKVPDNSLVVFSEEVNIPHINYAEIKEKYSKYRLLHVRQEIYNDDSKEN